MAEMLNLNSLPGFAGRHYAINREIARWAAERARGRLREYNPENGAAAARASGSETLEQLLERLGIVNDCPHGSAVECRVVGLEVAKLCRQCGARVADITGEALERDSAER